MFFELQKQQDKVSGFNLLEFSSVAHWPICDAFGLRLILWNQRARFGITGEHFIIYSSSLSIVNF
jgi:hypothetical protein